MSETAALRLHKGHTTHQRSAPFIHRFRYRLALIDIDIDRLDDAAAQSALFSVDKPGLFSFRRKDHANHDGTDLRTWAETKLTAAGIELDGGPIRLVTFPRHAFYKFAPISLWLGHGPDGALRGIIYEVNNTFGETHCYVAATPGPARHRHSADKAFHVSPFFDVSGRYRFTLRSDDDALSLSVETLHEGAQTHVATIKTKASPATTPAFAALAITRPIASLAVTLAIHWQALKLWIKGAKYVPKPTPPSRPQTIAAPDSSP